MTVLRALHDYYGRMLARGEADLPGFARQPISFAIFLAPDGTPVHVRPLLEQVGKKRIPRLLSVPSAGGRTVAIKPNLLWDKTAYALGRTGGKDTRTAAEHDAFKRDNLALIAGSDDPGLVAFRRFLETWRPGRFESEPFTPDMLDSNVVFALEGDDALYLHQREAAMTLLAARAAPEGAVAMCLVTGDEGPIERLHPPIRGVQGAQTSGAAIVSFNQAAFTSYGKTQGENAPTSHAAVTRYVTALNRMLERDSRNRLPRPIGDTTVVFWADTSASVSEAQAAAAEESFGFLVYPPTDDDERAKLGDFLHDLMDGKPLAEAKADIVPDTRFHVLGLAPNAARLSIRYWLTDTIEAFARRLAQHHADLRLEPSPWRAPPSVWLLLLKTTALKEDPENIPKLLAGEVMRAVLSGGPYPRSWLAAVLLRLRAGDDPSSGWHAAAIRAVLARRARITKGTPPPMSLNRDSTDPAYVCGRLFAVLENIQRRALGNVNATIRDRYMGAASATPATMFPLLLKNATNHLGKLRKGGKDHWLERELEDVHELVDGRWPRTLKLEAQGHFFLGYYHQRRAQFVRAAAAGETPDEATGHAGELGDISDAE